MTGQRNLGAGAFRPGLKGSSGSPPRAIRKAGHRLWKTGRHPLPYLSAQTDVTEFRALCGTDGRAAGRRDGKQTGGALKGPEEGHQRRRSEADREPQAWLVRADVPDRCPGPMASRCPHAWVASPLQRPCSVTEAVARPRVSQDGTPYDWLSPGPAVSRPSS